MNGIQGVDSDRSILVKFADDLNLSVLVKGTQDQLPKKWKTLIWAQNNLTTINLTKTKEIVVKSKVERPLPAITFDIKQEVFLKFLGVYFHSNPTNWDKQIDSLLGKAGGGMHIFRVCKDYGYSLDSLNHLFDSLIIPLFTYGILRWSVASYDKYLSKIDKFQKRAG